MLADRLNKPGGNVRQAKLAMANPIFTHPSEAGRCLFLINGLGMGNSTRCHAIIKQLDERGLRVDVLTSGNGLDYFSNRPEVASLIPTRGYHYSSHNGHVSGLRTAASLFNHYRIGQEKQSDLKALLKRLPVDLPLRPWPIAIITLKNRTLSPVAERFIEAARNIAKSFPSVSPT